MKLDRLFEMQAKLDDHIVKEKGLEGQDLLDKKILALQVELGELANELPEEFKFWSNKKNDMEKALKEYVDGLHFLLSIGNDLETTYKEKSIMDYEKWNTTQLFNAMYYQLAMFENEVHNLAPRTSQINAYRLIFNVFLSIGKRLGFTWEQIEQAYISKNEINHQRQEGGY